MIYSEKHCTRWHDTDADRNVKISAMLMYMQEASNHHMESCGMSLDELRDKKSLAFILSKTRMALYHKIGAFENIEVQTWTCPCHGLAIPRFYRILKGTTVIAEADTTWGLLDLENHKLVRSDECDIYSFKDMEPAPIDVPNRFKLPKDIFLESIGERHIVYSDLDYNMHMNNTRYPDMLCDFLPIEDTRRIKGVFLSYLNESAFGDTLCIMRAFFEGVYYFRTINKLTQKICLEAQIILSDKETK